MNQELFKKDLCNQSSLYKKIRKISVYEGKPSRANTKSTCFAVRKDEWDTTQRRIMKNALYVLRGMSKGMYLAEATSNSEKSSP